jgi:glycosyltransferase involved in cell wall biosynthesis
MKILHISPSYAPAFVYGGPTISISELAESQKKSGSKITVFTTTANGKSELIIGQNPSDVNGVRVYYFPRITKDNSHFSPKLLFALFKEMNHFDVIHIHSWWNLVTIPSVFLCKIFKKRIVFSPRGMLSFYSIKSASKKIFHFFFNRWLFKGSVLHSTSKQEADEALALIPNWDYFTLPNIIKLNYLPTSSEKLPDPERFNFICLSRIHPIKGHDILFQALSMLKMDWHLNIVGDGDVGYVAQLKKIAEDYGISDKIDWLGWRKGDEKFELLKDADLLLLPSLYESFANVALEALSVGTPVLVSDRVGFSEYVTNENLGWVTPLDPPDGWTKTIALAWESLEQRINIRRKAPYKIQHEFSAEYLAEQYLNAYRKFVP